MLRSGTASTPGRGRPGRRQRLLQQGHRQARPRGHDRPGPLFARAPGCL